MDDGRDVGADPVVFSQQIISLGQRQDTALEGGNILIDVAGARARQARDRLDGAERVLDAMIDLVEQVALLAQRLAERLQLADGMGLPHTQT